MIRTPDWALVAAAGDNYPKYFRDWWHHEVNWFAIHKTIYKMHPLVSWGRGALLHQRSTLIRLTFWYMRHQHTLSCLIKTQ